MKRLLFFALVLIAAACGAEAVPGGAPTTGPPGTTATTLPGGTQRLLLAGARDRWNANRPDSYRFTYNLACECDQGPWLLQVKGNDTIVSTRVDGGPGGLAPWESIDAIFAEIEATLDEGRFPVAVEYDPDLGYPAYFIFNEPELPVDGGFVLTVTEFESDPEPINASQQQAFREAVARWEAGGPDDYDFTFTRGCFCPMEYIGPYEVSVRGGEITSATFEGTDLLEIGVLNIASYSEIIQTVPGVFAEIERALGQADSLTAEYDPELGYPTEVYIDWVLNAADDEVSYSIRSLRVAGA